ESGFPALSFGTGERARDTPANTLARLQAGVRGIADAALSPHSAPGRAEFSVLRGVLDQGRLERLRILLSGRVLPRLQGAAAQGSEHGDAARDPPIDLAPIGMTDVSRIWRRLSRGAAARAPLGP